jgi:hypothetical protein
MHLLTIALWDAKKNSMWMYSSGVFIGLAYQGKDVVF